MSKEYFVLTAGKQLVNPLRMLSLDPDKYQPNLTKEMFEVMDSVVVAYFENKEGVEIPDILDHPTFMVSTIIKNLFLLYDDSIEFKAIQVFSIDQTDKTAPLYWMPDVPLVDCLHEDTAWYGNGTLKELVLKGEAIEGLDLFKVSSVLENRVIISLAMAESLMRRDLVGIGLEKVKIKMEV